MWRKKPNCDVTQKLKSWPNSKTQTVTKINSDSCDGSDKKILSPIWNILMRHFDEKYVYDILIRNFDETLWWDILIKHFYETFLWDILIRYFDETFWWDILMRHFNEIFEKTFWGVTKLKLIECQCLSSNLRTSWGVPCPKKKPN